MTYLSIQDDIMYFQFDTQSPKRLVELPAYTMGLLRELHNQLGKVGRSQQGRDSGHPTYEGMSQ